MGVVVKIPLSQETTPAFGYPFKQDGVARVGAHCMGPLPGNMQDMAEIIFLCDPQRSQQLSALSFNAESAELRRGKPVSLRCRIRQPGDQTGLFYLADWPYFSTHTTRKPRNDVQ